MHNKKKKKNSSLVMILTPVPVSILASWLWTASFVFLRLFLYRVSYTTMAVPVRQSVRVLIRYGKALPLNN